MSETLPHFSLIYGEGDEAVDLGKFIASYGGGITDINKPVGSKRNLTFSQGWGRYGQSYRSQTLSGEDITVTFMLTGIDQFKMVEFRTKLAQYLDAPNGTKQLRFNYDPNWYYNAIVRDSVTLTLDISTRTANGQIVFAVPDGLAHSRYSKVLNRNTTNSEIGSVEYNHKDSKIEITLNNSGSQEAHPKITLKHVDDTGYIGIANASGAFGMGNENYDQNGSVQDLGDTKSEVVLHIPYNNAKSKPLWDKEWRRYDLASIATIPNNLFGTNNRHPDTTLGFVKHSRLNWNHAGLGITGHGRSFTDKPDVMVWGGAWYEIDPDSNGDRGTVDWRLDFNIKFLAEVAGATGGVHVGVLDKNNHIIAGYDVFKNTNATSTAQVVFWAGDKRWRNDIYFDATKHSYFGNGKGDCYIVKNGANITFGYQGKPIGSTFPEVQHKQAKRLVIEISGANAEGRKANKHMACMTVPWIKLTKHDVKKYTRVNNPFKKGSATMINMKNGDVTTTEEPEVDKHGSYASDLIMNGSNYLSIPPGESKMIISLSEWTNTLPDIQVEWEETKW